MKKIIHVDLDAFYASVEQRDRPELRGKPVVVGGSPEGRGVVAAASYEARKFGIHSAMPAARVKRLCPHAVFVKPDFRKYKEASRIIRSIFEEVTDLIEPLSLDEAYLDVTENKLGEPSASRIAVYLRARIKGQTGLTASAGVSPLKFVSKIASDMNKPDGLTVVRPEEVDEFVRKLPVRKLWGVGPSTAQRLKGMGIETAADVRLLTREEMERRLGKQGRFIWNLAWGRDSRTVRSGRERKSRGSERTFSRDWTEFGPLEEALSDQADEIAKSMGKEGLSGRTITLKVRYSDFETITRSKTLSGGVRSGDQIRKTALELLMSATEVGKRPIRLIGVSVSGFESPDGRQLTMDLGEV